MPFIVKIGYQELLVKNEVQASKVISALAGAILLSCDYEDGKYRYWPSEREQSLAIEQIKAHQLFSENPKKAKASVTTLPEIDFPK